MSNVSTYLIYFDSKFDLKIDSKSTSNFKLVKLGFLVKSDVSTLFSFFKSDFVA